MRLAAAESPVGSKVAKGLKAQPCATADVPGSLRCIAVGGHILPRSVTERSRRRKVQPALESAKSPRQQQLSLENRGLVLDPLLELQVAADIDADAWNLTQIGDCLHRQGVQSVFAAGGRLEFRQQGEVESVGDAAFHLDDLGLFAIRRPAKEATRADFDLGDAASDIRGVDLVGETRFGRGRTRRNTQRHQRPNQQPSHLERSAIATHSHIELRMKVNCGSCRVGLTSTGLDPVSPIAFSKRVGRSRSATGAARRAWAQSRSCRRRCRPVDGGS